MVEILVKHDDGMWLGQSEGKKGKFKFNYVTIVEEKISLKNEAKAKLTSLQCNDLLGFLENLEIQSLYSRLTLNGYCEVSHLLELDQQRISELQIENKNHEDRLMSAVAVLQYLMHSETKRVLRYPIERTKNRNEDVLTQKTQQGNCFLEALTKFDSSPTFRNIPVCGKLHRNI